jgi:hypothetical protein
MSTLAILTAVRDRSRAVRVSVGRVTDQAADDERPAWWAAVARWVPPAGILLAALLFLVLPVVGAACGGDGPIGECWAGRQFLTGTPSVDTARISTAPSVLRSLVDTAALPSGARFLATVTLLVLAAGVASAAVPQPVRRSAATVASTLAGTVLLALTEIVATTGLAHNIRNIPGAFTLDPRVTVDDIVATGPGFWLALVVLAVTTLVGIGIFTGARRRAAEAAFRAPA